METSKQLKLELTVLFIGLSIACILFFGSTCNTQKVQTSPIKVEQKEVF